MTRKYVHYCAKKTGHALPDQIVAAEARLEYIQHKKQQRKQFGNFICNIRLVLQDSQCSEMEKLGDTICFLNSFLSREKDIN